MKTIIWLACFYALLIGTTLALPNGVEARGKKGNKKHPSKHPNKHPSKHPHPTYPHPSVTSTSTLVTSTSTTSTSTSSTATVTVSARTTTTTTTTTYSTVSTRSTVAAGSSFSPIRKQLSGHQITRRKVEEDQHAKRDVTVTATTSTTTTTTTITSIATISNNQPPLYAQCGSDNFVETIDGNYADYFSGIGTRTTVDLTITTAEYCCISCAQLGAACLAFLFREGTPDLRKRELPNLPVTASCTLLTANADGFCPAQYSVYTVPESTALVLGKTTLGNGACGRAFIDNRD